MASLCLGVRVALLAPQQQPLAPKHGYTPGIARSVVAPFLAAMADAI